MISKVTTEDLDLDFPPMTAPEITDKTIYQVGVSGGKDSAAVLLWMVRESGIDPAKIRASFCDIGNDHEWTLKHVQMLSEKVHPIEIIKPERGFYDLCLHKKTMPNPIARFCTHILKIEPTRDYLQSLRMQGIQPISVSGVRGDESADRSKLHEWDYNGIMLCVQWRPLIQWTIADVYAIHERHGIPLNPLYAAGAKRVGCWPCVMSQKSEIRNIAQNFPERIDALRKFESEMDQVIGRPWCSFFQGSKIPKRFHTKEIESAGGEKITTGSIDDVVRWSMTGKGAKGSWEDDQPEQEETGCTSGFCE